MKAHATKNWDIKPANGQGTWRHPLGIYMPATNRRYCRVTLLPVQAPPSGRGSGRSRQLARQFHSRTKKQRTARGQLARAVWTGWQPRGGFPRGYESHWRQHPDGPPVPSGDGSRRALRGSRERDRRPIADARGGALLQERPNRSAVREREPFPEGALVEDHARRFVAEPSCAKCGGRCGCDTGSRGRAKGCRGRRRSPALRQRYRGGEPGH
jgi:hypothetical protein